MVGIPPVGTNCAPLLADLFLYSYENEFLDKLIKEGKRKLARKFNLSYRYTDDLVSFNNMWILKNSTNLLSSLSHLGVHRATTIQTFDFSTLYTSIPHDLLRSLMYNIINNALKHKNGATWYTHIKVGRK